jgi:hypothetical protein
VFKKLSSTTEEGETKMTAKTCAACDEDVGDNPIKVKVGKNTVEVCCEACAIALREAEEAKSSPN